MSLYLGDKAIFFSPKLQRLPLKDDRQSLAVACPIYSKQQLK